MSQYSHDTELKIGGMSYNLDNLYINWSNPQLDIPKGSFSIGHVKFGFANVQIVHRQDAYSEYSTFSFSGPNFLLNNLLLRVVPKFKIQIFSAPSRSLMKRIFEPSGEKRG